MNRLTQNLQIINFQSQLHVPADVKPSSDFVQVGYTKHHRTKNQRFTALRGHRQR